MLPVTLCVVILAVSGASSAATATPQLGCDVETIQNQASPLSLPYNGGANLLFLVLLPGCINATRLSFLPACSANADVITSEPISVPMDLSFIDDTNAYTNLLVAHTSVPNKYYYHVCLSVETSGSDFSLATTYIVHVMNDPSAPLPSSPPQCVPGTGIMLVPCTLRKTAHPNIFRCNRESPDYCWCWKDSNESSVVRAIDCRPGFYEPWVTQTNPSDLDEWLDYRDELEF
eukprot:TRINITY_DN10753_c0_g1_i1.p1 TRINITY_DN10753_c0_g1~~TRINITY_DN10753_c0_g1_i1.p1  ORF type:complete len:231 (+),score=33.50 TRINITY_DN10753_c0_g1_i1:64-756(+)